MWTNGPQSSNYCVTFEITVMNMLKDEISNPTVEAHGRTGKVPKYDS